MDYETILNFLFYKTKSNFKLESLFNRNPAGIFVINLSCGIHQKIVDDIYFIESCPEGRKQVQVLSGIVDRPTPRSNEIFLASDEKWSCRGV